MHVKAHSELVGHTHVDHDQGNCSCGGHHSHAQVRLKQAVAGLVFVLNSYLYCFLVEPESAVAGFSAMIGAVLLGLPIIWVALKDLRLGSLNTNVLVALAVLALFASGHYREAGNATGRNQDKLPGKILSIPSIVPAGQLVLVHGGHPC